MKITQTTCDGAPIVLIYGGEGRGKTTLACKFPKPVAMLLERGLPHGVTVDAIDAPAPPAPIKDFYLSKVHRPMRRRTATRCRRRLQCPPTSTSAN